MHEECRALGRSRRGGLELRTPLGIILGYATFLIEDAPTPEAAEYADTVMKSALHLRSILDSMATLRYLTTSIKDLAPESIPLHTLRADLESEIASIPGAAGHTITIHDFPPNTIVIADRARLELAFANILDNAVRFTPPPGTIEIGATLRSNAASCDSGTLKATPIGSIWLMPSSAAPPGCTSEPRCTATVPMRPDSGALMVPKLTSTSAARSAACDAATAAFCAS